jgi:hypothetical protein
MKKLILIIASTLVVGAIIAAVLFFTRQSTSTHKKSAPSSHIAVIPPDHAAAMSEKERLELTLQKSWTNATEGTAANQTATPTAPTTDQEDPHVTLDFLDDLVVLATERYQPAHSLANPTSSDRLDLSVKSLNMHYGLSLEGLNDGREDMGSARQTILSYVLTPATLNFLFQLYGHECILRAQEQIAMKIKRFPGGSGDPELRLLTKEEQQSFFRLCGQKLQDIGEIFRAISANDRFAAGVENYLRLRTELNEAYYTFWGLKDSQADQENIDQAANTIKKAILAFDQGKKGLVASIDTRAHPSMTGEGDMIYIAKWAYRRVNNQSTSPETFATLGTNLVDLGGDFIRHAEGLE